MTRNELSQILVDAGIETPSKALVSALMGAFNDEKRNAIIEATDKAVKDYENWHSPDEWDARENEFTAYKEEQGKNERLAKYKALGVVDDEDIISMIDAKFKNSADADNEIAEYLKAHPLCKRVEETPNQEKENVSVAEKDEPKTEIKAIGNVKSNKANVKELSAVEKRFAELNPDIEI